MTAPVIYKGIKFPFQVGQSSLPKSATDDELIRDSLIQLITTRTGERVMRPDYGSNAYAFVFESNNALLSNLIRAEIQGVVAKYEPRVQLIDIQVEQQDASVIVTLQYIVLATGNVNATTLSMATP